jgi:TadE-like protein
MRIGASRIFINDRQGGVAVEFVALVPAFIFLTMFIFEIFIAVFWVGTAEKAAQLGARLAIVSGHAVTGLPTTYAKRTGYVYGQLCSAGACGATGTGFATVSCTGPNIGNCDPALCPGRTVTCFQDIVNRMRGIASFIQPANVTITYEYVGLGFAGGPVIPRVTVTVGVTPASVTPSGVGQPVPYGLFMTNMLSGFMSLATCNPFVTCSPSASPLTNMPTVTATFTGEDLSTAGAL